MRQIVQRAAEDWLSLRRPADGSAREATRPALQRLVRFLSSRLGPGEAVQVVDLGAGTGANLAWLAPRLALPQSWTLVDRDESLLSLVPKQRPSSDVVEVRQVAEELGQVMGRLDADRPTLVTCSAVLDVLTNSQVEDLCSEVARLGAAALFSLSVSGEVTLKPKASLDERINAAFNAHQGRSELAGPSAARLAAQTLERAGFDVEIIATPWRLGSADAPLIRRYLGERLTAAQQSDPSLAGPGQGWLDDRLQQLANGDLEVRVGHEDVLAIPGVASGP